ncbi:hypothetical protein M655_024985 [Brevibacillus sp. NSP2.1]|uniref:hypothetical protein n=1 Tax=Brevibacillus sp. NSP2.1 TaxID=3003229 RepID=UPI000479F276|nr:hypothetical protein [Brevibacillus sp. NSP2.1]QHZ58625.1 hypothetical protein M655_024985 [Brevibacillus sp. NSP2.1]
MHTFLAGLAIVAATIALWFAGVSITAWLVSTLVSFLFTVDFGFWQAFAAILLLGVFSNIAFSGLRRKTKE